MRLEPICSSLTKTLLPEYRNTRSLSYSPLSKIISSNVAPKEIPLKEVLKEWVHFLASLILLIWHRLFPQPRASESDQKNRELKNKNAELEDRLDRLKTKRKRDRKKIETEIKNKYQKQLTDFETGKKELEKQLEEQKKRHEQKIQDMMIEASGQRKDINEQRERMGKLHLVNQQLKKDIQALKKPSPQIKPGIGLKKLNLEKIEIPQETIQTALANLSLSPRASSLKKEPTESDKPPKRRISFDAGIVREKDENPS